MFLVFYRIESHFWLKRQNKLFRSTSWELWGMWDRWMSSQIHLTFINPVALNKPLSTKHMYIAANLFSSTIHVSRHSFPPPGRGRTSCAATPPSPRGWGGGSRTRGGRWRWASSLWPVFNLCLCCLCFSCYFLFFVFFWFCVCMCKSICMLECGGVDLEATKLELKHACVFLCACVVRV